MITRNRFAIALASLLLAGLSATAAAQQTPPAGGPPPPPPGRAGRAAQRNAAPQGQPPVNIGRAEIQIQEQWNVLVLRQSKSFLELNDQQYVNFFSKMTTLQDIRDHHLRDRRKLLNELRVMTGPNNQNPPTEAALETKRSQLDDLEAQFPQQEHAALQAVDEGLTPFQRARFRVFEEQMELHKLQMIAQVIRTVPPAGAGQQAGRDGAPPAAVKPGRGGGKQF